MPLVDVATRTPIQGPPQAATPASPARPVQHGQSSTASPARPVQHGQSSTAVACLLAGRNTRNRGGLDPTDRCTVGAITRDTLATAAFIVMHGEHPAADGPGPQFEQLATRGRPALAGTGDV